MVYVDLLTPSGEEKKIAECYPRSGRIGLFFDHMDGSIDQVMEAICHEVLGHIKLSDEWGSLTEHFSHSVARGRLSLENLSKNFWRTAKTDYDAETVHEVYALTNHIESMLDIYQNVLNPAQRDKYAAYVHHANEALALTMEDVSKPGFASAEMCTFLDELASQLEGLVHRLAECTILDPPAL